MAPDRDLVRRFRAEVADELGARMRADEADGKPRMRAVDQRMFGRTLINQRLARYAREQIEAGELPLDSEAETELAQAVHDKLFGLGVLQRLLEDDTIENIDVTGADNVWITRADGTKEPGPPVADNDAELIDLLRTTAARVGLTERRFDVGSPSLNVQLPDGSRMFAVMAVTNRPVVAIRRHRYPKVLLSDLQGLGTVDVATSSFLSAAVRARKNLIVCGGVDAGKTTMLRALINEIEPKERLVTIEDNFELGVDRYPDLHPDVVALEGRQRNVEGEGEVSLADLVRWGLRLNPDRVIVGEVRGDEVLPMLNAMSQGNDGSMCTIHANSTAGAFGKIAMYAVQAPERLPLDASNLLIANSIDFVVYIGRSQTDGTGRSVRYVSSIREVAGADGTMVASNEIFAPGADRRAVPASPMQSRNLDDLVAVGFDASVLNRPGGWW